MKSLDEYSFFLTFGGKKGFPTMVEAKPKPKYKKKTQPQTQTDGLRHCVFANHVLARCGTAYHESSVLPSQVD